MDARGKWNAHLMGNFLFHFGYGRKLNLKWSTDIFRDNCIFPFRFYRLTLQTPRSSKIIRRFFFSLVKTKWWSKSAQMMASSFDSKGEREREMTKRDIIGFAFVCSSFEFGAYSVRRLVLFFILHLQHKGNKTMESITNSITWRGIVNGNDI